MSKTMLLTGIIIVASLSQSFAGDAAFAAKPAVSRDGGTVKISFAVSAPTDVEVAVLSSSNVVRHLAAGVLGGKLPPPEPLQPGLSQVILWDGKDDSGREVQGVNDKSAAFSVRVRAGTGVKFGRFIGDDPCNFGGLESVAADEAGNVYAAGARGEGNQMAMCVRVFDSDGRYLREILPFPADLQPGAMKEVGWWDADAGTWRPRNLRNLNPDFYGQPGGYWGNPSFSLVGASSKDGVILTDGNRIFKLGSDGSVVGKSFTQGGLWGKKALPNIGNGPLHLTPSPDGKYLYLSGPFSSNDQYGHVADPDFPPGQVYRMEIGKGSMVPFVKLPTIGSRANSGWTSKHISHADHYTTPHGPIHGIALDKDGNVYVADQDNQCVVAFSPEGKEIGKIAIPYPDIVAVHPRTGAIYVMTKEIKGYQQYRKTLVKFSGLTEGKKEATLDLGTDGGNMPKMALAAGEKSTVLWLTGVAGGLKPVEDKGATLEVVKNQFGRKKSAPNDWGRLAVDYERDEIYVSNYCVGFWRYNGQTGEGGAIAKNGTELAVGYDGLLYIRTGTGFSGPLERFTRDLAPAPYKETGTHVLSKYIYSRMGNGMAERGLGVGPDGKVYISFMYKWVAYAVGGWGADGKPLEGKYLKGVFPGKGEYPPELKSAIIGPVPSMNGGMRVDTKGFIYMGMMTRPPGFTPPKAFEKDQGYRVSVGSVVKFDPKEGGAMPFDPKFGDGGGEGAEGAFRTSKMQGVLNYYPGLAPFSSSAEGFGNNTCCVCRVPRFDIDRYNRLILPNAMTSSVLLYDNAGNLILEFGKYGNFDSLYVNPNTETGKAGKPTVATPEIPMAWPTSAGFSEKAIYVVDTYNRRALRVDPTWKVEETVEIK